MPQKEAHEELRGSPGQELRGSPKTGSRKRGLPRSHAKFRAPSQLMKRFSPQNGRSGGHFRNIFESPSAKSPGSVRAPSQFFAFRRKKQILPKSPVSSLGSAERTRFKNVPKKWRNHTSYSAERTIFQKERIFDKIIKTQTETPKARNRGNPGKIREKRPDRGSRGHTRPQHRRMNFMILHLSFGGGVWHLFSFFFVLPPVIFLVCPLLVADVVFLSFVFFIVSFCLCCFFQVRRTRKRRKTNGRKMRKEEKTKKKQKQKKKTKYKKKETQQGRKTKEA